VAATADTVRELALALLDVSEAPSYGTPGFRVGKKLFARLHQDGESLVVRVDLYERELLLKANPKVFFLTDHYVGYPWVLLRLAAVGPALLKKTLQQAYETARAEGALRRRSARR
jgi:hypothetical protein